jgi:hypothetical protein
VQRNLPAAAAAMTSVRGDVVADACLASRLINRHDLSTTISPITRRTCSRSRRSSAAYCGCHFAGAKHFPRANLGDDDDGSTRSSDRALHGTVVDCRSHTRFAPTQAFPTTTARVEIHICEAYLFIHTKVQPKATNCPPAYFAHRR